MRKKWKIALISGALVFTCGLYTWGIPAIVNIKSHKAFIENKILENTGYKFDIGNPEMSMGFFPSVWVKSDNLSLLNADNTKALSVDNPRVNIKLLPLLWHKVEVSSLYADNFDVNLVYSKESKFLIGSYPIELPKEKSEYTFSKLNLNLGKYNIYLKDELNSKNLSFKGEYLEHGGYVRDKHLKLATKGIFSADNKDTNIYTDLDINLPIDRISEDKLRIFASVKDFDLSSISNYASTLTGGRIQSLAGIVNFDADTQKDDFGHKNILINLTTNNLKILGKDKASSVIYDDNLSAVIDFATLENGLDFKNVSLKADKIHINGNGRLYNLGKGRTPKYNLTGEVKNTRLEDVVAILPGSETILPDFNLYKLKKYVIYGNGEGKVNFKGQGNRPFVNGKINLNDVYLMHPMKGAPANAEVNMNFKDQKMKMNVFVPAANNQHVELKGDVWIDGSKYSELNVTSTEAVPLAPAQEIINPLHEILKFQLGPVPMMTISGIGNLDVRSAGKKVDPHIWGRINFKNGTASFNDVHNLVLNNGSGEVVFNDTEVTFKTHHATVNGLPIEIHGDCAVLGKLNVYVTSKGQDVKKLVKIINTSPILIDVQKVIAPFTQPDGVADVFLHIYGTAKNAEEVVFNEDLFAKGTVTLHNSRTVIQDTFLPFTKVNGVVNFDQYNSDYDVSGNVRNSFVHVWGTGTNNDIDLKAHSDNFEINDVFDMLHPDMIMPFKKDLGKIHALFDASYKGSVENGELDYNKIKVNGKFLPNMVSSDFIRQNGGTFTINNGFLTTSTLNGLFSGVPYTLSFVAKDLDKEDFSISEAKFNFKNFDISHIESMKSQIKLPKDFATLVDNISDFQGVIDINGTVSNNNIIADTNLADISFKYKPLDAIVQIAGGKANIRGDVLYLDKVNSRVSSMPVFLDGKISDIYSEKPSLNLSLSAKLTQMFFDRFFNSKSVYPVKAKGNINFQANLNGRLDALSAKSVLNLGENSSIYYMGATLAGVPTGTLNAEEMTTNPVSIISDIVLYPNRVKINSLRYNQIISSQSKKKSIQNQLWANGELSLLKDNIIGFKDFRIKTENPTNAKIFNVLFKKPTIKQGVFSADLNINGTSETPYVLGSMNIKSVDIPVMNSTIKDVNLDFQKDYINVSSTGVIITNDVLLDAKIVNKPIKPIEVESLNIQMEEINLNDIATALSDFEADYTRTTRHKSQNAEQIFPADVIIIKDAQINADNILIKKAVATDFKTHMTIDENQLLNVDNYSFNIAKGTVDGNVKYDLKNLNGSAQMNINNADAQIIAENFFDMSGQVFGTVTGSLNAACTGISSLDCVNTLSGEGHFEVAHGRMPKLGSLEYLLKAGNLITGGVTGVSINGIIDLITPLKTGEFSSIKGDIHVKDGIADDIKVYSSGKDLNLYMTGSYNLSTLVADMEIYGSLSKNFSTILGKISNASLNTLFNTIPGIKINDINPESTSNMLKIPNFDKDNVLRVFKAEIFGDINGTNYVKSFRWIKK